MRRAVARAVRAEPQRLVVARPCRCGYGAAPGGGHTSAVPARPAARNPNLAHGRPPTPRGRGLMPAPPRRAAARNYRRAGVDVDVIQRMGGWKTASMFKRYNIIDERDLHDAADRLEAFLATEASAPPTVVPLRRRS